MDKQGLLEDDARMTTEFSGQSSLCIIAESGFLYLRKLEYGETKGQSEHVASAARRDADSIRFYSIPAYHGRNI